MLRYFLVLLACYLFKTSDCTAQYLAATGDYKADTLSADQLKLAVNAVKEKKVVGLGEAEHLKSSYYKIKSQLLKSLVEQHNFSLVLLEASLNACQLLDRYIKGDDHVDLRTALKEMNATNDYVLKNIYNTPGIGELFAWLRAYNKANNNRVSIGGIDFQNPVLLGNAIREEIKKSAADSVDYYVAKLDDAVALYSRFYKGYMDYKNIFKIYKVDSLKASAITAHKAVYALQRFAGGSQWLDINLQNLRAMSDFYVDPNAMLLRDSAMFNNLRYYADQRPDAKIIVWAATQHLQEQKQSFGGRDYRWMGNFIRSRWGNQFANIGVYGPENCLPAPTPAGKVTVEVVLKSGQYGECFNTRNEEVIISIKAPQVTNAVVL
jgi:erythromycin esterase-like protein